MAARHALYALTTGDFQQVNHWLNQFKLKLEQDDGDVSTKGDKNNDHDKFRLDHNRLISQFYSNPSRANVDQFLFFISSFLSISQQPLFLHLTINHVKSLYQHVGPVTLYNLGVIAYHQAFFMSALILVDFLFDHIEALDDWLAFLSCFLATDVYLRVGRTSAASLALAHAEKLLACFTSNTTSSPSSPLHRENTMQPSPPPSFSTTTASFKTSSDPNNERSAPETSKNNFSLPRLSPPWKGCDSTLLTIPHSTDDAKFCIHIYNARIAQAVVSTALSSLTSPTPSSASSSATVANMKDVRIKESRQALVLALQHNSSDKPMSAALLVRAHIDQFHFVKCLQTLLAIASHCPDELSFCKAGPIALNSLGVLHHRLGRYALATCYFERSRKAFNAVAEIARPNGNGQPQLCATDPKFDSLSNSNGGGHVVDRTDGEYHKSDCTNILNENNENYNYNSNNDENLETITESKQENGSQNHESQSDTPRNSPNTHKPYILSIMNLARDSHVAYNLALQYMTTGKFSRALELFSICARTDPATASSSALLWIRMAECCIGMEYSGREVHASLSHEGRGRSRRMIIRRGKKADIATMEYAACCAEAALKILDDRCNKSVNRDSSDSAVNKTTDNDDEQRKHLRQNKFLQATRKLSRLDQYQLQQQQHQSESHLSSIPLSSSSNYDSLKSNKSEDADNDELHETFTNDKNLDLIINDNVIYKNELTSDVSLFARSMDKSSFTPSLSPTISTANTKSNKMNKSYSESGGSNSNENRPSTSHPNSTSPLSSSSNMYYQLEQDDVELRGAALTLIACASLSFDAIAVIKACDQLSKLYEHCQENERWALSQLYAAEAFCMLNRPVDATNLLSPLLAANFPMESHAREAAYVNMAMTHVCENDLVAASRSAKLALKMYTSSGSPRHRNIRKQAVFVASYIFLRCGETEAAREALRLLHNNASAD